MKSELWVWQVRAGVFKFFGHPVYEIVGIMLMVISASLLFVGIRKYRTIKKLNADIDPEDWQALEAMIKKDRMFNMQILLIG